MTVDKHIASSIPLAVTAYVVTGSYWAVLGAIIGSVLIDVDHWIEFWWDCGFSINVKKFFKFGNSGVNTLQFIFLHSVELIPVYLIIGHFSGTQDFFNWVVLGMLLHMSLDYINMLRRFDYRWYSFLMFSFSYRLSHRFCRFKIERALT